MGRFAYTTCRKTGSQWVKDVLTDPQIFAAQGLHYHQPPDKYRADAFAAEPDGTFVAPAFDLSYDRWHQVAGPDDRCVVVVRDPRDVVVSWAFSMAYSHATDAEVRIIRPAMLALDLRGKLEVTTFVIKDPLRVQRSWVRGAPTARARVYRFEDLVADEVGTFGSMLDYFGWTVDATDLRAAVARHTFSARTGGRERGDKNPFSHYRNALPGDWRNYFDQDLGQRFEAALPGLVRELGYERADDWWTAQPEKIAELTLGAVETERLRTELAVARAELARVRVAAEGLLRRYEALEELERQLARRAAEVGGRG
jgi:hypothetical protein